MKTFEVDYGGCIIIEAEDEEEAKEKCLDIEQNDLFIEVEDIREIEIVKED